MISNKGKILYFLLLVLSSYAVSCGNNEVEVDEAFIDKSFLEKEPCAAPCWYGLELDKSTEDDVYAVLEQLPFVKQDSIVQKGTGWMNDDSATSISYKCMYQKNGTCGWIIISKGKVVQIAMSVNYELELSLIVSELDEPDYITYFTPMHYTGCDISLDWPEKQIFVSSESDEKCPAPNTKISPDAKATFLSYTTFERIALIAEENKYPWPGFAQP